MLPNTVKPLRSITAPLGAGLLLLLHLSCGFSPLPFFPEQPWHSQEPLSPNRMNFGKLSVYYGDLHNHSNLSDGIGSPREAYDYARQQGHMDFFSLADHDYLLTNDKWNLLKATADSCNEDSAFVALWGFEWSSWTYDHCAVIGSEEYCSSIDSTTDTFTELCGWLAERRAFAFFNHPGRLGSDIEFNRFSDSPIDQFVGMELWNKSDGFNQYYYTDGMFPDDNNKGFFDEALSRGWRIGAAGGGDNHRASWGTANNYRMGILAPACTRTAITEALAARRFFSTLNKNIALNFTDNGFAMGSIVHDTQHQFTITALDANREPFTEIMLYNGAHNTVAVWHPESTAVTVTWETTVSADDYFYVHVRQADGDEAISSPIWVTTTAP